MLNSDLTTCLRGMDGMTPFAKALVVAAADEIERLRKANADLLHVCKMIDGALAVGNGINRRSQPIGGKTYISQLKAAITQAEKI